MAAYKCHKHPTAYVDVAGKCAVCKDFAFGPPVKHKSKTSVRWAFMKWFDIPDSRDVNYTYLRRLRIISTPYFGLFLHFIFTPDLDQDPHDHPWNFWSFIVRGAYHEYIYDPSGSNLVVKDVPGYEKSHWQANRFARWSMHKMPIRLAHQIMWAGPGLVTLIFHTRRKREWGFWLWRTNEFVPWQQYNTSKYGTAEKTGIPREKVDEFG